MIYVFTGGHNRYVYLPSSMVIHFDSQRCDMRNQSQAHGLAINIRFVITNYDWLKEMFDSDRKKARQVNLINLISTG